MKDQQAVDSMRASRGAGDNERCVHKKLLCPQVRTTKTANAEPPRVSAFVFTSLAVSVPCQLRSAGGRTIRLRIPPPRAPCGAERSPRS